MNPPPPSRRRSDVPAPLRQPQQARSRATLRRILDAAEKLLEKRSFDEVAIAEIARRARSSVGAFYARFPDKEALLHHLHERRSAEVAAAVRDFSARGRSPEEALSIRVEELVRFLVALHRDRPGTLRALTVTAERHATPGDGAIGAQALAPLVELMLERREQIRHDDPRLAAELGLAMVLSTVRERVLFPESQTAGELDDERLIRELARAYCAYLVAQLP